MLLKTSISLLMCGSRIKREQTHLSDLSLVISSWLQTLWKEGEEIIYTVIFMKNLTIRVYQWLYRLKSLKFKTQLLRNLRTIMSNK